VKKDIRKPVIYASILAVLFAYRFIIWAWARTASPASAQTASVAGRTIPAD